MKRLPSGRLFGRPTPCHGPWHVVCAIPLVAVVGAYFAGRVWTGHLMLEPLLAVPPALAGIGATTPWRPLVYGALSLATASGISVHQFVTRPSLPIAIIVSVVVVTTVAAVGAVLAARRNQQLARVMRVAETAQRALLRPLPSRIGPLELDMLYLAAAEEAQVGGDLYGVARTPYGIRLIVGDVRGKGLDAVEVAADVLSLFREAAHDAPRLAQVARRLDASLTRRDGSDEEYVTAVLVEVDAAFTRATIYNCGHPAPILLAVDPDGAVPSAVKVADVPAPAPPLGLMSLGDCSRAGLSLPLNRRDELLLYTDGITEARDARRQFYPFTDRIAVLADGNGGSGAGLLERLRADLLHHTGAPLDDDVALLLVRAVNASAPAAGAPGPPAADQAADSPAGPAPMAAPVSQTAIPSARGDPMGTRQPHRQADAPTATPARRRG